MAVKFAVDKLREKAKRLHREYEALCVFTNRLTTSDRRRVEFEREKLGTAKKSALPPIIRKLEQAISDFRKDWGFLVPNSEIVEILAEIESAPKDELARMSKAGIGDICTGYKKYWVIFDDLPSHTLVAIDPGTFREKPNEISWFLLEAAVFEDMCVFFNQAKEIEPKIRPHGPSHKISFKIHSALLRATVLATFHFVEAYLNGMAFDYYYASKEDEITEETKSLLFDWNPKTKRPRYLSLRDKALQYPKIILGLEQPPLQESNCPELKCILEALEIRHSLTHISPKREFERIASNEGARFYTVRPSDVEKIVDSYIGFIRKLENLVHGETLRLHWLHDRRPDGMFPDAVFD